MLIHTSNTLDSQIQRSTERLNSIESIVGGNTTSVSTRVDERIPKLMIKFKERPILGWGFSTEGLRSQDSHVGFHNMLREGGILEIIVFIIFFIQIVGKLWVLSKRRGILASERNSLLFAAISFLSLMIIHAASSQLFGYFVGFYAADKWFMISLILVGFNVFYRQTEWAIQARFHKYAGTGLREINSEDATNLNK